MKPPSLKDLHAHCSRQLDIARATSGRAKRLTPEMVRELECAATLPVLLGYLRTVRTGQGAYLSDLLVHDTILAPETICPSGGLLPSVSNYPAVQAEKPGVNNLTENPASVNRGRAGETL